MAKTMKKATSKEEHKFVETLSVENRLAGGFGMRGAKQTPEALLRRAVMNCLLWEDLAYESGDSVAENIKNLIPQVDPYIVGEIAVEARRVQKLRHVPLYITRVMAGLNTHKHVVSDLLSSVIERPDELAEFLAIYWKDGRTPVSAQVKKGLANAFHKFNEYQFAKYRGKNNEIKLRDVLRLVHPTPNTMAQSNLFEKILHDELETPDTWEVALSSGADKKATWERLIQEGKLGALAFLRNLRNMENVKVSPSIISKGLKSISPRWLMPLNFFSAVRYAPRYTLEIEQMMMKSFENTPKLPGYTILVIDISGSMKHNTISGRSEMTYYDVAKAMAVIASNTCENISVYATAGNDGTHKHKTELVHPARGFALSSNIDSLYNTLGGGGIFTRQALEYIKTQEGDRTPDRIIVFSDSQDCDNVNKVPDPFGKRNYIVNISSHAHGVNYDGIWTSEISGWSERFIDYIRAMEGQGLEEEE